jgi:hypothetical protein
MASPAINVCPLCQGEMEVVYYRNGQQVLVCKDCHAGLTVPASAWEIARTKRAANYLAAVHGSRT